MTKDSLDDLKEEIDEMELYLDVLPDGFSDEALELANDIDRKQGFLNLGNGLKKMGLNVEYLGPNLDGIVKVDSYQVK